MGYGWGVNNSEAPLGDVKIVEFAGIGPAPFASMILAGLGANVIRIDKPPSFATPAGTDLFSSDAMNRDRRSIALDLKSPGAIAIVKRLISSSDGVIEGFRPGVMERLGLGPDVLLDLNPRLTFVRMTGWGQSGPLAQTAGHDLNFIAITGLLNAIGTKESAVVPLNLVGDFGGGGTMAAIGMLSGIIRARAGGKGSVVDAAIVDGVSLMGTMFQGLISKGLWTVDRGENLLDGGAPFYSIYRCENGKDLAVASLEPKFFVELCSRLGLSGHPAFADQYRRDTWPEMRKVLTEIFSKKSQEYFVELFAGADACVMPVNSFSDAKRDSHLMERGVFEEVQGISHPRSAPRFENFHPVIAPAPFPGEHRDEILGELGYFAQEISAFEESGAFG